MVWCQISAFDHVTRVWSRLGESPLEGLVLVVGHRWDFSIRGNQLVLFHSSLCAAPINHANCWLEPVLDATLSWILIKSAVVDSVSPPVWNKRFPAACVSGNSLSFAVKEKATPSAVWRAYQCFSISVSSYSWANRCCTASSKASLRCLQEIFAAWREEEACLRTSRQQNSFSCRTPSDIPRI